MCLCRLICVVLSVSCCLSTQTTQHRQHNTDSLCCVVCVLLSVSVNTTQTTPHRLSVSVSCCLCLRRLVCAVINECVCIVFTNSMNKTHTQVAPVIPRACVCRVRNECVCVVLCVSCCLCLCRVVCVCVVLSVPCSMSVSMSCSTSSLNKTHAHVDPVILKECVCRLVCVYVVLSASCSMSVSVCR